MRKHQLVEIICLLFIFLFVYAAVSKLADYEKFRVQLGQSPLLTSFAGWLAWILPLVEIGIAVSLAFSSTRMPGLFASFSIMTMFTAYIVAITRFSDYVPCSCGGILQKMSWNEHLVFNIVFVILALAAIIMHSRRPIEGRS